MSNIKTIFIIILSINLLLYASGLRLIDTVDDNVNRLVNVDGDDLYTTGGNIKQSDDLEQAGSSLTVFQESGSGGLFDLLDGLKIINQFFIFIVNIVFTPLALFAGGILPPIFGLIIGLPMLTTAMIYAAYYVRGIK